MPDKVKDLSWITSNLTVLKGHRDRIQFLGHLRDNVEFDLYGKGFHFIEDKWDGLAPYRYALAIENFQNPLYWTEKIADCFLAWTMPIYDGCTHITNYFPAEAMVLIDIHDPVTAIDQIREAIKGDRRERNLEAIAYARELVLQRYQLFPFLAAEIRAHELDHVASTSKRMMISDAPSPADRLYARLTNTGKKMRRYTEPKRWLRKVRSMRSKKES